MIVNLGGRTGPRTEAAVATGPEGEPAGAGRPAPRWVGALAVAAVAAAPVAEAVRIVIQRGYVVLDGDEALLELGARRAVHLDQLVGPYSRVGFHDPGPVLFYLLAPFVWVLGPGGPGLFLGAIAISGAALIATVAVLWRLAGPVAALWAATSIDLYCLCLPVGTLREPWNPYLVVTPMLLFVVLWAAGVTGSSRAAIGAVVVGSYEIQTYIATAGFVVTMTAILGMSLVVTARRGRRARSAERRRPGPGLLAGVVVLVLVWLPSVVELWRDHPNNLVRLWDFFGSSPTPTWGQVIRVAADALTIMPFGYHDYTLTLSRNGAEIGIGASLAVVGLVTALALGWRRQQPLSLALAGSGVFGAAIGLVSLSRAATPLYLYFAVWLAFVPISFLLAIGVALLAPSRLPAGGAPAGCGPAPGRRDARSSRRIAPLLVVAATVVAAMALRSDLHMASVTTSSGAGPWPAPTDQSQAARSRAIRDTAAFSAAAEEVLRPTDRWVRFTLSPTSPWPYVAGMVLQLDERGVQSSVAPASWELYFGHERGPGHRATVEFWLSPSTDPSSGGRVLRVIDGDVLSYKRTPG